EALFGGGGSLDNVPSANVSSTDLKEGINFLDTLVEVGFIKSKSEGRRLVEQNGLSLNDEKIKDFNFILEEKYFSNGTAMVKKGKKDYLQLKVN
ncbi:MAG: S4 domain-containing protein, partial [Sphaerochaetaceae bacterium]|nr:S4 domain-containing protein [Sphaerochaetaceae bacterium]